MDRYLINWKTGGRTQIEITDELISVIKNAEQSIKIGNFFFEYRSVIEALKEAVNRGVAVFILSNPQIDKQNNNTDYKSHLDNLIYLSSIGAHVRYLNDLHAKFIVSDDCKGIVTSANNNSTSLSKNSETGVTISGNDAKVLSRVYGNLFLNADLTHIARNGKFTVKSHQLKRSFEIDTNDLLQSNVRVTIDSEDQTNLWRKDINQIYDELVGIIDRAKSHCYIVTWHFNCAGKSLQRFYDSLRNAKQRGVKVTLFCCAFDTAGSQENYNQPSLKRLSPVVDEIFGDENNHSKCIVTESEGFVFSSNIDPRGLETGFEVGVILSEPQRQAALQHINNLISTNPQNLKEQWLKLKN